MTTLLMLALVSSTPPQAPPLREANSVQLPQAPLLKTDYADVLQAVKSGKSVRIYVGHDAPKDAKDAVRLELFDGHKSGVFWCFPDATGEPSYIPLDNSGGSKITPEQPVKSATNSGTAVVPAGHHAHRYPDGTTLIHGNDNLGKAAPHAGLAYPWTRIAEAGQTVKAPPAKEPSFIPLQSFFPSAQSCPDGKCPNAAPATSKRWWR